MVDLGDGQHSRDDGIDAHDGGFLNIEDPPSGQVNVGGVWYGMPADIETQ